MVKKTFKQFLICRLRLQVLYQSKGWSNVDEKAEQNAGKILSAVDGDTDGTLTEDEFLEVASRDDLVCLVLGSE